MSGIVNTIGTGRSGVVGSDQIYVDTWRMNSNYTGNSDPITAWERDDNYGHANYWGSPMTMSSGIFTFPTTGFWEVDSWISFYLNGDSRYHEYRCLYSSNAYSL